MRWSQTTHFLFEIFIFPWSLCHRDIYSCRETYLTHISQMIVLLSLTNYMTCSTYKGDQNVLSGHPSSSLGRVHTIKAESLFTAAQVQPGALCYRSALLPPLLSSLSLDRIIKVKKIAQKQKQNCVDQDWVNLKPFFVFVKDKDSVCQFTCMNVGCAPILYNANELSVTWLWVHWNFYKTSFLFCFSLFIVLHE